MLYSGKQRVSARRIRFARSGALGLILVVLLAGCSLSHIKKSIDKINRENSATGSLESFIQNELTSKFHKSVRSVSCAPYVDEVLQQDTAHMTCKVRFTDGTGYTTPGTVYDPSTDPDYNTYTYSFDDPPGVDITKAPLPGPILNLPANSPHSLFLARNLTPVVKTLVSHFGSHDLILQMAIYPGEVEAVIAASGGKAWLATATYYNTLKAGKQTSFSGSAQRNRLLPARPDGYPGTRDEDRGQGRDQPRQHQPFRPHLIAPAERGMEHLPDQGQQAVPVPRTRTAPR